jgi:uncharacterized protein (TIGR02145 family)/uncharacterized repeat protein (TIGR02543 family)
LYSAVLNKLTPGGSDTLIFTVTDKSTKANSKSFTVIVRYNRKPNPAILSTPAANAISVALKPTFTWTDGTDPDGDAVTYTLKYGTTQTNLNQSITGMTTKQYTLATDLTAATDYYWLIMTNTANGDSIISDLHKFTTVDAAPRITADPEPKRLRVGNTATFSIIATGSNPTYQWQKGAANVTAGTGAKTPTYTTAAIAAGDNGSTYRCIVTNDGGADTSTPATLTIVHSVIYNDNGKSGGSVPTDGSTYADGEPVTVKLNSESLVKTGYAFAGWNAKADGTGTDFPPGSGTFTMSTGDVIIYAKWVVIPYSITYIIDGSTYSGNPSSYTVETATFNLPRPTKAGYLLSEWYLASDLSGTAITSIPKGTIGIKTFYAKWLNTYSVTYDANGGGGGTVPVDSKTYIAGSTVLLLDNSGSLTNTAFSFDGWSRTKKYKANDAPVTSFQIGSTNETLYARWVVEDYDGNKYDAVTIGDQTWLVQNLRTTRFRNGGSIFNAIDSANWVYRGESREDPIYCWPHNSVSEGQTYGALYNWYAATDTNIAPVGWHVPSAEEYTTLFQNSAQDCKVLAAVGQFPEATNSTGFTGIITPTRDNSAGFSDISGGNGSLFLWSSSPQVEYAYISKSIYLPPQMWNYCTKNYGYPIRCVKD